MVSIAASLTQQPLGRLWMPLSCHQDIQIFEKGASANDDLRYLAEAGNLTSLLVRGASFHARSVAGCAV